MELVTFLIDLFLHLDEYLDTIITQYGAWTYGILFVVIFVETGLVIMPFLPGDSLLFAAGTFAALGSLNVWVLAGLLIVAAILGDTVNYSIGHYLGERAYNIKWIKKEYFDKTHAFFERHGGKAIFLQAVKMKPDCVPDLGFDFEYCCCGGDAAGQVWHVG